MNRVDQGASSGEDRALASRAQGLGPPGFDPSRVYRSEGYQMYLEYAPDERGDPTKELWCFSNEDSGSDGEGYLELRVSEIVETKHSGTLAVYYRRWIAPDGEPAWGRKERRSVGSLGSLKALMRRRKMTPCDSDGSRNGGDARGSVHDSAGPKDIAQ